MDDVNGTKEERFDMRHLAGCLLDFLEVGLVIALLTTNEPLTAIKCGFGVIIILMLRE